MQFGMTLAISLLMVSVCLVNGQEAVLNDTCGACEMTCKFFSQYCKNGKLFLLFLVPLENGFQVYCQLERSDSALKPKFGSVDPISYLLTSFTVWCLALTVYGVVGAADLAKFDLFTSLEEVNKLTYASLSNADDTIHAKTMTESLKDVFKPALSLPIMPANHGSLRSLSSPKQHKNLQKSKAKIRLSIWLSNGITTNAFHSMMFSDVF